MIYLHFVLTAVLDLQMQRILKQIWEYTASFLLRCRLVQVNQTSPVTRDCVCFWILHSRFCITIKTELSISLFLSTPCRREEPYFCGKSCIDTPDKEYIVHAILRVLICYCGARERINLFIEELSLVRVLLASKTSLLG